VRDAWDPDKAAANQRRHGVGFAEAMTLDDDDSLWVRRDDAHSQQEERFHLVGISNRNRVLFVACTYRHGRLRPISARRATKRERNEYWFRRRRA
jgi:uncharacterized DUF497 family protein